MVRYVRCLWYQVTRRASVASRHLAPRRVALLGSVWHCTHAHTMRMTHIVNRSLLLYRTLLAHLPLFVESIRKDLKVTLLRQHPTFLTFPWKNNLFRSPNR